MVGRVSIAVQTAKSIGVESVEEADPKSLAQKSSSSVSLTYVNVALLFLGVILLHESDRLIIVYRFKY